MSYRWEHRGSVWSNVRSYVLVGDDGRAVGKVDMLRDGSGWIATMPPMGGTVHARVTDAMRAATDALGIDGSELG